MIYRIHKRVRQHGFTLIELMVVMAIIAILVGLTVAAVMKFFGKADETKRRSDISQMQDNVAQFKAKFGVPYMPSRFVLRADITQYRPRSVDPLEADSKEFLVKMFGDRVGQGVTLAWAGYTTDASGNTVPIAFAQPTILSGDQCLVFFL